jgi:hypothetical protein
MLIIREKKMITVIVSLVAGCMFGFMIGVSLERRRK